ILLNLALNARDAMPKGGTLSIVTLAGLPGETPTDGVTPWPYPGAGARLIVADTGMGMDEATQKRIFEPFFTTKEIGKGTGLGLATVYGIVQALDARIRFRSTLGRGTTFEIDFAPAGSTTIDTSIVLSESALEPVKPGMVLLVEDDDGVRLLTRRVLEHEGYEVLLAHSPEAALKLMEANASTIRVMLTDVVMPTMNGRELANRCREKRSGLPVIFMSGYTPDEILQQGVELEYSYFLPKPYTPAGLLQVLQKAMMQGPASRMKRDP
ncbi:MAG: response regulator, partial [Gemmataceae bacterium]